jgi:hypothetical protein
MLTYNRYCEDLKKFNQPITMTEAEFEVKYSLVEDELHRKFCNHTMDEYSKEKPKLPKKPSVGLTNKELAKRARRAEYMKEYRKR